MPIIALISPAIMAYVVVCIFLQSFYRTRHRRGTSDRRVSSCVQTMYNGQNQWQRRKKLPRDTSGRGDIQIFIKASTEKSMKKWRVDMSPLRASARVGYPTRALLRGLIEGRHLEFSQEKDGPRRHPYNSFFTIPPVGEIHRDPKRQFCGSTLQTRDLHGRQLSYRVFRKEILASINMTYHISF